jgi:hypothetical protein
MQLGTEEDKKSFHLIHGVMYQRIEQLAMVVENDEGLTEDKKSAAKGNKKRKKVGRKPQYPSNQEQNKQGVELKSTLGVFF